MERLERSTAPVEETYRIAPPPKRDQSGMPRTKTSMAEKLAALAVGESRTVWSVAEPSRFVDGALRLSGGQFRTSKAADRYAWTVERVA